MRICYYALRPVQVGTDVRQPGDLIPEAVEWPFLPGYIRDGYVAPVLVATLPEDVQAMLLEWEADQRAEAAGTAQETTSTTPQGDGATATSENKKKEKVA